MAKITNITTVFPDGVTAGLPIKSEQMGKFTFKHKGRPQTSSTYDISSYATIPDTWTTLSHTKSGTSFNQSLSSMCNIGYRGNVEFSSSNNLSFTVNSSSVSKTGGTVTATTTNIGSVILQMQASTASTGQRSTTVTTYFYKPGDTHIGSASDPTSEINAKTNCSYTTNTLKQNVGTAYTDASTSVTAKASVGGTSLDTDSHTFKPNNYTTNHTFSLYIPSNDGGWTTTTYAYTTSNNVIAAANGSSITFTLSTVPQVSQPSARTISLSASASNSGHYNQVGTQSGIKGFTFNPSSFTQQPNLIADPTWSWSGAGGNYNYSVSGNQYTIKATSGHQWQTQVSSVGNITVGNASVSDNTRSRTATIGTVNCTTPTDEYIGCISCVCSNTSGFSCSSNGSFYRAWANEAAGTGNTNNAQNANWNVSWSVTSAGGCTNYSTSGASTQSYTISVPGVRYGVSSVTKPSGSYSISLAHNVYSGSHDLQGGTINYTGDKDNPPTYTFSVQAVISSATRTGNSITKTGTVSITRPDYNTGVTRSYSCAFSGNANGWTAKIEDGKLKVTAPETYLASSSATVTITITATGGDGTSASATYNVSLSKAACSWTANISNGSAG